MKAKQFPSIGLVALTYSMVLLATRFTAATAGCNSMYRGDGDCDDDNNTEDCGWDNGDCCEETCIDSEYVCGTDRGFNCLNPKYRDDDYLQSSSYSYVFWCGNWNSGNGECDKQNNSEQCGYDGGDCCVESCVDGDYACGQNESFHCLDPGYSYYFEIDDDDDFSGYNDYSKESSYWFSYDFHERYNNAPRWAPCQDERVGNGYCDSANNFADCGYYDGGDCCAETCVDRGYVCGVDSYLYCMDPEYYTPY